MDIRKLQRAIVDGLEDVKAQDIQVYNTEHLSALFERVIIASGTSNRQTKALASSVRNAVRSQGMPVLATEGSDNGEWIIVDCGAAVAHIMQPAIRDYYRLEEIWGGKPVKLKLGTAPSKGLPKAEAVDGDEDEDDDAPTRQPAAKKAAPAKKAAASKTPGRKTPAKPASARKPSAGSPSAKTPGAKAPAKSASRSAGGAAAKSGARSAAKPPARPAAERAAPARQAAAKKAPAGKSAPARGGSGSPARKAATGKPARKTPARG